MDPRSVRHRGCVDLRPVRDLPASLPRHIPQGFTALIVAITFFAGVQLLFLGLIGEYLGRVYDEAKGRPHYIVATVVGQREAATHADLEVAFRREPSRLERIG